MTVDLAALIATLAGLTMLALALAVRPRRASSIDFYLAGQRIGVVTNALAICGDYFSAASFLGVAAAVYVSGLDGVWYAAGFAAGFVPVLLFVAAPMRRFGQYSLPDFLGRRLVSDQVRLAAVGVVQIIVLSYLIPQAVASGITWSLLVGSGVLGLDAYATGVVVATTTIAGLVAFGGMRGTTWTQALQFVLMMAVLVWLAAMVLGSGFSYTGAVEDLSRQPLLNPVLVDGQWQLQPVRSALQSDAPARFDEPGARYSVLGQTMLLITLMLGTAGLPHVMNRYFTSPTGREARRTTVWVLGAAGVFYMLAVMLGTAARSVIEQVADTTPWLADLTVDGVLRIPEHAMLTLGRLSAGQAGLATIAIAALVAVISTMAGLLLAAAASWGHDTFAGVVNRRATQAQVVLAGRLAVVGTAAVAAVVALQLEPASLSALFPSAVATMVTWAFAVAGSALTPVIILSIWWRRTTAAGAVAGLFVGSGTAITMFLIALLRPDWSVATLLLTPTPVAAPCAIIAAVVVSLRTEVPADLPELWVRLHGTAADRAAERLARLTIRSAEAHRPPSDQVRVGGTGRWS
ncbi:MAG TPA: cation acetate symporter [Euzebyales bacterium]|nr:cation acetate symporter [Euzebyales bacterium]